MSEGAKIYNFEIERERILKERAEKKAQEARGKENEAPDDAIDYANIPKIGGEDIAPPEDPRRYAEYLLQVFMMGYEKAIRTYTQSLEYDLDEMSFEEAEQIFKRNLETRRESLKAASDEELISVLHDHRVGGGEYGLAAAIAAAELLNERTR